MGASQPEGSLLRGALRCLTLSEPPWEASTCRFPGGPSCSEPPGRQVTPRLSPDPGFYQEIRERGLNTSHESDDDMLDEPPSPDGTGRADAPIVVKSYRPAQITWSQLPEVGPGWWALGPSEPARAPQCGEQPSQSTYYAQRAGEPLPGALRAALPRGHSELSSMG